MAEPTPLTSHIITIADVTTWLAEYGFRAHDVCEATIHIGSSAEGVNAWLDIEWYKLDGNGNRYRDPIDTEMAALGRASIPLHSWPALTPCGRKAGKSNG